MWMRLRLLVINNIAITTQNDFKFHIKMSSYFRNENPISNKNVFFFFVVLLNCLDVLYSRSSKIATPIKATFYQCHSYSNSLNRHNRQLSRNKSNGRWDRHFFFSILFNFYSYFINLYIYINNSFIFICWIFVSYHFCSKSFSLSQYFSLSVSCYILPHINCSFLFFLLGLKFHFRIYTHIHNTQMYRIDSISLSHFINNVWYILLHLF